MASAALYLRTNSCNPAYTGVPYRGIGKYSDCLLLLSLRCCTSPHLHRHRSLMCGTGKLSAQLNNPGGNPSPVRRMEITNPFYWKSRFR